MLLGENWNSNTAFTSWTAFDLPEMGRTPTEARIFLNYYGNFEGNILCYNMRTLTVTAGVMYNNSLSVSPTYKHSPNGLGVIFTNGSVIDIGTPMNSTYGLWSGTTISFWAYIQSQLSGTYGVLFASCAYPSTWVFALAQQDAVNRLSVDIVNCTSLAQWNSITTCYNTWTHFMVAVQSYTVQLFKNGASYGSQFSVTTQYAPTYGTNYIGGKTIAIVSATSAHFTGYISEFYIFNQVGSNALVDAQSLYANNYPACWFKRYGYYDVHSTSALTNIHLKYSYNNTLDNDNYRFFSTATAFGTTAYATGLFGANALYIHNNSAGVLHYGAGTRYLPTVNRAVNWFSNFSDTAFSLVALWANSGEFGAMIIKDTTTCHSIWLNAGNGNSGTRYSLSGVLQANTFNNYHVNFTGTNADVYVNASLLASKAMTMTNYDTGDAYSALCIGFYPSLTGGTVFNTTPMVIQNLYFYNTALPSYEISGLATTGQHVNTVSCLNSNNSGGMRGYTQFEFSYGSNIMSYGANFNISYQKTNLTGITQTTYILPMRTMGIFTSLGLSTSYTGTYNNNILSQSANYLAIGLVAASQVCLWNNLSINKIYTDVNDAGALNAYLPLNSTTVDATGNGNNGTWTISSASYGMYGQDRVENSYAKFNNTTTNNFITIPNVFSTTINRMSIGLWVYMNEFYYTTSAQRYNLLGNINTFAAGSGTVYGSGTGFQFGFYQPDASLATWRLTFNHYIAPSITGLADAIIMILSSSVYAQPIQQFISTWTHLFVTFNNGSVSAYMNGILYTSSSAPNTYIYNLSQNPIMINKTFVNSVKNANCFEKNIRLYNSELSASEVRTIYDQEKRAIRHLPNFNN